MTNQFTDIVSVSQANRILGIQYLSDGKIQELDVETKNSEIVMDILNNKIGSSIAINRREKTKINTEVYVNFGKEPVDFVFNMRIVYLDLTEPVKKIVERLVSIFFI